jgi:hypothetical protein
VYHLRGIEGNRGSFEGAMPVDRLRNASVKKVLTYLDLDPLFFYPLDWIVVAGGFQCFLTDR